MSIPGNTKGVNRASIPFVIPINADGSATGTPSSESGSAPTNATQAALAASAVIKATAGNLYGLSGYNSGPEQFIQLHDAASLPADAAVPVHNIIVPAISNFSIDFGVYGMAFATGIVVCNSSTAETKTIGAADCQFFARYK